MARSLHRKGDLSDVTVPVNDRGRFRRAATVFVGFANHSGQESGMTYEWSDDAWAATLRVQRRRAGRHGEFTREATTLRRRTRVRVPELVF